MHACNDYVAVEWQSACLLNLAVEKPIVPSLLSPLLPLPPGSKR
jgi:hypothetical protein